MPDLLLFDPGNLLAAGFGSALTLTFASLSHAVGVWRTA